MGLYHRYGNLCLLAMAAGIGVAHMLADFYLGRDDDKLPADFLAHNVQPAATVGAMLFALWQAVLHHFNRQIVRQLVRGQARAFAVVLFNFNQLGLCLRAGKDLRLVE